MEDTRRLTTTTSPAEAVCRDFAAQYPTPNVQRGVRLAEEGAITWEALARVAEKALRDALAA